MKKIDEAINRISTLECPTGDVENRVIGILEDYGIASSEQINVHRDKSYDRAKAEGYKVEIAGQDQSFVVLASSGYDDYVAKVENVYSE